MTDASTAPDLINIPARDWQKARRRLAVIRDLAELSDRTRADAEAAGSRNSQCQRNECSKSLRRYDAWITGAGSLFADTDIES